MKSPSYIAQLLNRSKKSFALVAIVLLLQAMVSVALPLPVRFMIDHVLSFSDLESGVRFGGFHFSAIVILVLMSGAVLGLGLLACLFEYVEGITTTNIMARLMGEARSDLLAKLLTRRQSYMDGKLKVELLGRVSSDVSNIEILVVHGLPALLRGVPTVLFLIAVMFMINVKFTAIFVVFLPVLFCLVRRYTRRMRTTTRRVRVLTSAFEQETEFALSSLALIKSLNVEERAIRVLSARARQVASSYQENNRSELLVEGSFSLSRNLVRAVLLFVGCWAVIRREMTIGDLFLYISYLETLAEPVDEITGFVSQFTRGTVSMSRVNDLHRELARNAETSGLFPLERKAIARSSRPLVFDRVSFRFDESPDLLQDFSLAFERHSLIALVGPSGAGKSSFVRLLNRLHDPVAGRILLANRDLRDYRLADLRRAVRVISQEPYLLSGTIRENLLLASERRRSDEDLWRALRLANAEELVRGLPLGLKTMVGEGGKPLSGGQSRRISLARGFLCDECEIVVFDEPTAGLDPVSARVVMSSIERLAREKTLVFWVTHQSREVPFADRVLYFQKHSNPVLSHHLTLLSGDDSYRGLFSSGMGHKPFAADA